jgi:hypothetical protein
VLTLLNDAEWSKLTGSEIARRVGVSHDMACRMKAEHDSSLSSNESDTRRTYTTKHGTEAQMNVATPEPVSLTAQSQPYTMRRANRAPAHMEHQMRT